MIRRIIESFRQGRDEAIADARRRFDRDPRRPEPQPEWQPEPEEPAEYQDHRDYQDYRDNHDGPSQQHEPPPQPDDRLAEELRACAADRDEKARLLDEKTRILKDVTEYAGQLQAHIDELEAAVQSLVKTLHLPGLKIALMQRYHPDKHPEADADLRAHLTEAVKTINDAYAIIEKLHASG